MVKMEIRGGRHTLMCLPGRCQPYNLASVFTAMYRAGSGLLELICEKPTIHIFSQIHIQWLHVGSLKSAIIWNWKILQVGTFFFSALESQYFKVFNSTSLSPRLRETLGILKIGILIRDLHIKLWFWRTAYLG